MVEKRSDVLVHGTWARTHDNVWTRLVDALPCSLALLLPDTFHSESAELDGLRGACRSGSDGV